MADQSEILIIGGGAIGVCAAYYLTEAGRRVTLLERADICAGSSYGNAGWVAAGHIMPIPAPGLLTQGLKWLLDPGGPFYIKPRLDLDLIRWLWRFQQACTAQQVARVIPLFVALNRHSWRLFETLAARPDLDFGYQRRGLLHLFRDRAGLQKGLIEARHVRPHGLETAVLDGAGLRHLEPNLSPDVRYGIYYPEYAHLRPDQFVHALAEQAQAGGAELRPGCEVIGFQTAGREIKTVRTTKGDFAADQVILAAGAWSPLVTRELGLRLPVQAAKGYSLTFKRPAQGPGMPLSVPEYKVAITPMGERLRMSSTLELAGLDRSINHRRLAIIRRAAQHYLLGSAEFELLETWRGFRPLTPDDLPIIGRSPNYENLILATGHGMLGITYGPVTGQLVAQLAGGEEPLVDLEPFSPARFG